MNDDSGDAPQQSTKIFDISSDFDIKQVNEEASEQTTKSDVGSVSVVAKANNQSAPVTKPAQTSDQTNANFAVRTPFPSKLNVLSTQANFNGATIPANQTQVTKPSIQKTVTQNVVSPSANTPTPNVAPSISTPNPSIPKTTPPISQPTQNISATPVSNSQPTVQAPLYQSPNVRPIRTYEGDLAEALAHNRTSVATIAIAESKKKEGQEVISNKKETPEENSGTGRKVLLFLLSLILIGAGIVGAYYLYTKSPLVTSKPTTIYTPKPVIKSIVPADRHYSLNIDGMTRDQIRERLLQESQKQYEPNTVTDIVITKTVNGAKNKVPLSAMVADMDITAPSILVKSFLPDWMLGIYTDEQGNNDLFVTAQSDFFQDSFAGMLSWEKVMADDIRSYITNENVKNIVNGPPIPTTVEVKKPEIKIVTKTTNKKATTTKNATTSTEIATTTEITEETLTPFRTLRGQFSDRIVKSRDARVFKTSEGKTLFVYSFIDGKTLIISGKENTLSELITRLEKQAFVR